MVTRTLGTPWLWLQQVTTAFFAWGVFVGMAAATRRNDHFYLAEITKRMTGRPRNDDRDREPRSIVLVVAALLIWCGSQNALLDLGSYRMPSLIPLTVYTAIVPLAGVLIFLFTLEQLVNGWKHGFEGPEDQDDSREPVLMSPAAVLLLMTVLFLAFGYMGVPVVVRAHRRRAGRDRVHADQHAVDDRPAVPRHRLRDAARGPVLPAGRRADGLLRRGARMIRLSQTLVGHLRGGLAQVVTLFSMFFAGISGSSTADVAVLSRTVAREMDSEGTTAPSPRR